MTRYKAEFIGRGKNAIGIFYPIISHIEAENKEQANLKLYDTYDHIQQLKLTEVK